MPDALPTLERETSADRDPLAELKALEARIAARNRALGLPELTDEEAEALADEIVGEAFDSLVERGVLVFERDLPRS